MLHEPANRCGCDHSTDYKMRLGMKMFIFYFLLYAGFVAINVTSPVSMEKIILFGMNLACVYGFGLIIAALVLALIYDALCRNCEDNPPPVDSTGQGGAA
ncbi:MAG: DUF485 domain-containing protein [Candidatus Wallbacteria bacterium]|nr:DUF485 domain-containing protein [Candidatus Wallbacteria bacterium]